MKPPVILAAMLLHYLTARKLFATHLLTMIAFPAVCDRIQTPGACGHSLAAPAVLQMTANSKHVPHEVVYARCGT
jgi:hypothetical protein